ncbi:MAG: hypothetical protein LBC68_02950, partial [Prevotellaceae bacterium]|nr:hypothetical protein [Prevotellaceae bacterium]
MSRTVNKKRAAEKTNLYNFRITFALYFNKKIRYENKEIENEKSKYIHRSYNIVIWNVKLH